LTALTVEQRELASRYANLAFKAARRWQVRYPLLGEELHDAAMNALLEAARKYDASFGVKFTTYLFERIRLRSCDALRSSIARLKKQGVPVHYEDSHSPSGKDSARDWLCEELLALMTPQQGIIAWYYFVDGLTCPEIAPEVGLSRNRVHCILNEALSELRGHRSVKAIDPRG